MQVKNHLLFDDHGKQVPYKATPNVSGGTIVPTYLIEHFTADTSDTGAIGWLTSKESKVSAHLVIDRKGKITQLAPFNKKCWHAGESKWGSVIGLNSHAIGIEIVNAGRLTFKNGKYYTSTGEVVTDALYLTHKNETHASWWQKYTDAQLAAVKGATEAIVAAYSLLDVLGHDDIAPGRKVDPGPAFPMAEMKPEKVIHGKSTTANVNLRKGAGTSYSIITELPKGTQVQVLDSDNDSWVHVYVTNSKLTGWVSGAYLK